MNIQLKFIFCLSSVRNNPQYSYYYESHARTANTNENTSSFYGISRMKKLPNYVIIAMCTGVALIGVLLQVFVIRYVLLLMIIFLFELGASKG